MAPTSPTGTKRFTHCAAAGDGEGLSGAALALGRALGVGVAVAETGGRCTGDGARRASTANPMTTDPATTAAVRIASAIALSGRPTRKGAAVAVANLLAWRLRGLTSGFVSQHLHLERITR